MALVIDLKPNEKVIIGSSTITNDKQRTRLRIEGDAPILREKDTLTPEQATTPSKKLYLTIQEMYLAKPENAPEKFDDYFNRLEAIQKMAPHISNFLNDISIQILQGTYYKALKLVHDLINYEQDGKEPAPDTPSKDAKMTSSSMDAELLSQSAAQLEDTYNNWDTMLPDERNANISYNRKLWMVFFDGVNTESSKQPSRPPRHALDIQLNIINLYNFIYKRSSSIIEKGDKEKIKTLIFLNRAAAKAMLRF